MDLELVVYVNLTQMQLTIQSVWGQIWQKNNVEKDPLPSDLVMDYEIITQIEGEEKVIQFIMLND